MSSGCLQMNVAMRLGIIVAALLSACTLDGRNKTGCRSSSDCLGGYMCNASEQCVQMRDGGGNIGAADDGPAPPMCPASAVSACPPAETGTRCEETFCGSWRLWQEGVMRSVFVPFQIKDPWGLFSPTYLTAIRAGAEAWEQASGGFVRFQECTSCAVPFISVVPAVGDGIINPESDGEQTLPMPVVGSGDRISPHRIAHQWGHALGLTHTYVRADRDRYMRFNPATWCGPGGSGLPPRCAAGPPGPDGLPAVTTGTFGVFDETSKMNGFLSDGLCAAGAPNADSHEPTIGDVSALAELFFGVVARWSPFRPIGRSVSPTQPLDYQLAPGVDPVGSPAIASVNSSYARPEIFVRGDNNVVYTTTRSDLATTEWSEWTPLVGDVDGDPAVVFATFSPLLETLYLAVRSREDGNIHLRVRRDGQWGMWKVLAAPPSGAASAPALASESPVDLHVFVRGGDGLIYWLACNDASDDCADSAGKPDAWSALPPPPSGIFVGKPSAVWLLDSGGLAVAAIRDDRVAMFSMRVHLGGSTWRVADKLNVDLDRDDPDPGVAITLTPEPGELAFFARNRRLLLVNPTTAMTYFPIGGVLASPPAAVAIYHGAVRTDVAAIIDDHGRPGVWWRFHDEAYKAPCNYNRPGTCAECGLPP